MHRSHLVVVPIVSGALVVGLAGCDREADGEARTGVAPTGIAPASSSPTSSGTTAATGAPGAVAAGLALAPGDSTVLTVTDWAQIKARHGAGDLTSADIATDRLAFWRSVGADTVLLTDGALRAENSRLGLRYGFTQDDALWEARWTGDDPSADGGGLALRLRDDLDTAGVQRAVADAVPGVAGAELTDHLLVRGASANATDTLAARGALVAVAGDAESQYLQRGCSSWPTALGVDATAEQQDAVLAAVDEADLVDLDAFAVGFVGRDAEARLAYPEGTTEAAATADATVRIALTGVWPTTEAVGFSDAFGLPPDATGPGYAVQLSGGRPVVTVPLRVVSTTAAATVTLSQTTPLAVCGEVVLLDEPTGLGGDDD